ncbi:hypothetical protein C8R45DRAFT_968058 [Mycena sanguinolenta]|nr:hypothetical protein C8R45DRAFT_968058 [Mycena sanguinolenta]
MASLCEPEYIVPKDRFATNHTYQKIRLHPAQRYFYRVHRERGHGAFKPGVGFRASSCATMHPPIDAQYPGDYIVLRKMASKHITQYKDHTWTQPTDFVSGSYSLPYVLFETRRRNLRDPGNRMHISVIDSWKLTADAWLGTELVGAWWNRDTFFARWAEEVLVYKHVPHHAVVITRPADDFFRFLPHWCSGPEFRQEIGRWSTRAVANHIRGLVEQAYTSQAKRLLIESSVARSTILLKTVLPPDMEHFDECTHAEAVDTIARFAAIFCWWPEWITGTDPDKYPELLEQITETLLEKLRERKAADLARRASALEAAICRGLKEATSHFQRRIPTGIERTLNVTPRMAPYVQKHRVLGGAS